MIYEIEELSSSILDRHTYRYDKSGDKKYRLTCQGKMVQRVGNMPPRVSIIDLKDNFIVKLSDRVLENIVEVDISDNCLIDLPLMPNVKKIRCQFNHIKHLRSYPQLIELDCRYNKMVSIGDYPNLEVLRCSNNNLKELGYCPNLKELHCDYGKVGNLDQFKHAEWKYYNHKTGQYI